MGVQGRTRPPDEGARRIVLAYRARLVEDSRAPVITLSLLTRLRSRQDDSYGAKVLAALRNEFGGHEVKQD